MNSLFALAAGIVFGAGLCLSGMTRPDKILGFLDFFGDWDPTLMFVMAGAVLVHAVTLRVVKRAARPKYAAEFESPSENKVTGRLVLGSALFGLGWGTSGFCPGPAVVALASGAVYPFVFTAAMLAGMFLFRLTRKTSESDASCG